MTALWTEPLSDWPSRLQSLIEGMYDRRLHEGTMVTLTLLLYDGLTLAALYLAHNGYGQPTYDAHGCAQPGPKLRTTWREEILAACLPVHTMNTLVNELRSSLPCNTVDTLLVVTAREVAKIAENTPTECCTRERQRTRQP